MFSINLSIIFLNLKNLIGNPDMATNGPACICLPVRQAGANRIPKAFGSGVRGAPRQLRMVGRLLDCKLALIRL